MANIHELFKEYGESHQNSTNKLLHWACIPLIMLSLIGLLWSIPSPDFFKSIGLNWGTLFLTFAMVYYFMLSPIIAVGMFIVSILLIIMNISIANAVNHSLLNHFYVSIAIFIVSWIGQLIGHKIEGKKPSFLKDIQFFLIGPAWFLGFIYKKLNIKY